MRGASIAVREGEAEEKSSSAATMATTRAFSFCWSWSGVISKTRRKGKRKETREEMEKKVENFSVSRLFFPSFLPHHSTLVDQEMTPSLPLLLARRRLLPVDGRPPGLPPSRVQRPGAPVTAVAFWGEAAEEAAEAAGRGEGGRAAATRGAAAACCCSPATGAAACSPSTRRPLPQAETGRRR